MKKLMVWAFASTAFLQRMQNDERKDNPKLVKERRKRKS